MASPDSRHRKSPGAQLPAPLVGRVFPSHCHLPVELRRVDKGEVGDCERPPVLGHPLGKRYPASSTRGRQSSLQIGFANANARERLRLRQTGWPQPGSNLARGPVGKRTSVARRSGRWPHSVLWRRRRPASRAGPSQAAPWAAQQTDTLITPKPGQPQNGTHSQGNMRPARFIFLI